MNTLKIWIITNDPLPNLINSLRQSLTIPVIEKNVRTEEDKRKIKKYSKFIPALVLIDRSNIHRYFGKVDDLGSLKSILGWLKTIRIEF